MLESHIYPDSKISVWELLLHLNFTRKDHIPVLTVALDCRGLGFSFHWSMLLHLDMPNLGKDDFAIFESYGWLAFELFNLGIAEAIVTIIALKSGISSFLSLLYTPKEVLERFLHSLQGVLQDLRIDLFVLWSDLFDFRKLSCLHLIGDTH